MYVAAFENETADKAIDIMVSARPFKTDGSRPAISPLSVS